MLKIPTQCILYLIVIPTLSHPQVFLQSEGQKLIDIIDLTPTQSWLSLIESKEIYERKLKEFSWSCLKQNSSILNES